MHVSEILKNKGTEVVATRPGETIADTARLLAGRRIGAVLVTDDDGAVTGIISERDIVGAIGREGERALQMTVADLMTRDVVCCEPGDTLTEVMEMMTNRRIRHLPVMVADKLEGVISIGDVVKYRLEEAQMEVDALRHYVAGSG
jgi:CBS domain-containing protein